MWIENIKEYVGNMMKHVETCKKYGELVYVGNNYEEICGNM